MLSILLKSIHGMDTIPFVFVLLVLPVGAWGLFRSFHSLTSHFNKDERFMVSTVPVSTRSTQSSSSSSSSSSSIEDEMLEFIRRTLRLTPMRLLGPASLVARSLLSMSLQMERKFIRLPHEYLEELKPMGNNETSNDAIIFVHGGAFSLVDSSDLFIYERLVSLYAANEKHTIPTFYAVLYDVSESTGELPKSEKIRNQVMEAYEEVLARGKRVVLLAGDSAGGNLVISICLELIRGQRQDILPENLFLISPWVDLFSIAPSYARNADADLIDQQWLSDSKHQYLGPTMSELGTQFCRLQTAEYLSRVLSHSTMNVQVVVFDMDQCLVARHSMGRLRIGSDLVDYLSRITPDFVVLAKALHKRGIRLAIATHSDSVEYDAPFRSRATHIIGDDLAKAVLSHSLPELADSFHIVAWNPSARGNNKDQDSDKKRHMREIAEFYQVDTSQCILFDDDRGNCENTDSCFRAFRVNPRHGFRLTSALVHAVVSSGEHGIDGGTELWTEAVDEGLDDSLLDFWTSRGMDHIELLCPSLAKHEQLAELPRTLICTGDRDVFVDDVKTFATRLIKAQNNIQPQPQQHVPSMDMQRRVDVPSTPSPSSAAASAALRRTRPSRLIIAPNDIHCYPILWRHPVHRILVHFPLGEWLFRYLFPKRAHAIGDHPVHSKTADEALMEMFQFIEEATTPNVMEPLVGSPLASVESSSSSSSTSPVPVVPMQEVIAAGGSPLSTIAE